MDVEPEGVESTPMEVEGVPPLPLLGVGVGGAGAAWVEQWRDKAAKGLLTSGDFKDHWRVWVPRIFSPQMGKSCLEWSFDEDRAREVLFDTLEEFICGGGCDPRTRLGELSELEAPPSVCGRVFKMGEPTYYCRECGMDATCVLCVDCFKKSVHRNHKYKMGTSSGGGCCDCGDVEAWKKDAYCDIHAEGLERRQRSGARLPEDVAERTRAVFSAVLWYAYHLLTLEHVPHLPSDLCSRDADDEPLGYGTNTAGDNFCTVLYNDETHTFEQVINTLARVIKCSQRDAIEFVTNIDREGRAVVKCFKYHNCCELKAEIEKFTSRHGNRALKVSVVHAHVVAHQLYAMRLLTWLQKLLGQCEGFRIVFSEVALQVKSPDTSIVEGILLRDSSLWKAARLHWHRLFISGMLMEYESKKAFARVFTKNYCSVMKDFIRDDHDHSFSVASLAVQIYTVPTLAHFLIANDDVLMLLLNTFVSECVRKTNKAGKLAFERNVSNATFKRAQYVLYDLRYLLGVVPEVWTDELRRGVLAGLSMLLKLLNMMQDMDAVTRQVGQHMEYEPEWESAFNLHVKLAPVITLMLKWCGSDRVVLIKAYRATLKKLYENPSPTPVPAAGGVAPVTNEVRELADHAASCVQYDVATQPVSIHLPLSRFLAGLHLHLEKHGLNFDSPEFQMKTKQSPEQIVEPALRTQVMISQVHAGMWRRNGYSLLNQLYFYHSVKCRQEMLDKDIVLLQTGAALIESNEFLIHLLNKFGLVNWAHPQFETNTLKNPEEDSMRQTISLVEEFLGLLITLVGERYTEGIGRVTQDECIRKEIIQQLCVKPLSHSELNKTLPDDVNHETGMERVINDVADFKKNHSSGKGVYELKPEYYDQYNAYFYHYTREELSKSEEEQRRRRKAAGELECCPPPPLPPLSDSFAMCANLLQCDVMLHVMQIVLERSVNLRARSFSEAQLGKVLHLIGYALHEEERQNCQFMMFTERADKWRLEQHMQMLSKSPRIEVHKDLLTYILQKYRKVQAAAVRKRDGESTESHEAMEGEGQEPSGSGGGSQESSTDEKTWRAARAAERRAKIMAQMMAMQKSFMKENAKLFNSTTADDESSATVMDELIILESNRDDPSAPFAPVCLGPKRTMRLHMRQTYTCILCQEDQTVSADGPALVYAAFVQKSTVLCRNRNSTEGEFDEQDPLFLPYKLGPAPHTSTCGHVMHAACWQRYFDNVLAKENRRPYRLRQPASFDVEKNEFLCPLCESLSNTVLPLIPSLSTLGRNGSQEMEGVDMDDWIKGIEAALKAKKKKIGQSKPAKAVKAREEPPKLMLPLEEPGQSGGSGSVSTSKAVSVPALAAILGASSDEEMEAIDTSDEEFTLDVAEAVAGAATTVRSTRDIPLPESDNTMQLLLFSRADQSDVQGQFSVELLEMMVLFSQATFTMGLGAHPNQDDARVPLMAWKSCAYTIHALESLTRSCGKPALGDLSNRQHDCIQAVVRVAAVIGSTWKHEQVINGHAFRLLSLVLENPHDGPSLLDWDSFGVLVPLTISIPSLFYTEQPIPVPAGTALELLTVHLMFLANTAQILLTCDLRGDGEPMEEEAEQGADDNTERLREMLVALRGEAAASGMCARAAWRAVQRASLPFLRCCTLFYRHLTGVPAPTSLAAPGGDTFAAMCAYLGLPTACRDLLAPAAFAPLVRKWAAHPAVKEWNARPAGAPCRDPATVNRLVSLPDDYSELINTVSLFTCPHSDREDSRNPTMCLVCGEMLCSQSYCCQTELNKTLVGACTSHAHECGAGACIFLRVRECEVLLLSSPNRGCFMTPPYLDDYGETDQGLRRGNPLRLCRERYRKLQLLWLGHGIQEEIARAMEATNSLVPTQWQHL